MNKKELEKSFEQNKKKIYKELKEAGYKSFEDLSLQHKVHKNYAEYFAPVCKDLLELRLRMTGVKKIPIWNKTEFNGLNPDFDYEARQMGLKNLNHVAKQFEKYGYNSFYFCTLSADYKDLISMINDFKNIEASNKRLGISTKRYIERVKLDSQAHMRTDQIYRMALLNIYMQEFPEDFEWMKTNLA